MESFAKYIGVPGVLALSTTIALIVWVSLGIPVPPEVYGLIGASWGYYFGTNGKAIRNDVMEANANVTKSDAPVK
jgi:hypothetical protein